MHMLKKSIRLHLPAMMIKDYRLMIELHDALMEQVLENFAMQSC